MNHPPVKMPAYRVSKQHEGLYYVFDEEGERVARVARFMPGPMVLVEGARITSPALAKVIARAMVRLANDLEREADWRCPNGCDNPQPAWWPAPHGGKTPPCSNCDAPLEIGEAHD